MAIPGVELKGTALIAEGLASPRASLLEARGEACRDPKYDNLDFLYGNTEFGQFVVRQQSEYQ